MAGLTPAQLRTAFETFERHSNSLGKLGAFASLAFSADSADEAAKALYARIRGDLTEIHNEMQFFDLELQQGPQGDLRRLARRAGAGGLPLLVVALAPTPRRSPC